MTRRDVERAEYLAVVAFIVAGCASLAAAAVTIAAILTALGWGG